MTEAQLLVQLVLCLFMVWTLHVVPKLRKQINEQFDEQKMQINDMQHRQISYLQRQIDEMKRELEELKRKE